MPACPVGGRCGFVYFLIRDIVKTRGCFLKGGNQRVNARDQRSGVNDFIRGRFVDIRNDCAQRGNAAVRRQLDNNVDDTGDSIGAFRKDNGRLIAGNRTDNRYGCAVRTDDISIRHAGQRDGFTAVKYVDANQISPVVL